MRCCPSLVLSVPNMHFSSHFLEEKAKRAEGGGKIEIYVEYTSCRVRFGPISLHRLMSVNSFNYVFIVARMCRLDRGEVSPALAANYKIHVAFGTFVNEQQQKTLTMPIMTM